MNANEREEISASVAAHAELGPRYDAAVAEGLVERIGEEIDRRIDERLRGGQAPGQGFGARRAPAPAAMTAGPAHAQAPAGVSRRGTGFWGTVLALGSLGIGVGATGAVVSHHSPPAAQVFMILLIWLAIAVVNVAHARRRY